MAYITTDDGTDIFYEYHRNENDQTIVFLNGMTQSVVHWKSHVKALVDDVDILRYDARGQGKSDLSSDNFTLKRHTQDLKQLIDDLELSEVTLVGFSHGGRIATGFAHHYGEYVDGLALCGVSQQDTTRARTIVRGWREVLERGDLTALAWASLPVIIGQDYLDQNEQVLEGIVRATVDRNNRDGIKKLLDALVEYPAIGELAGEVSTDAIVMAGENDMLVNWSGVEELAQQLDAESIQVSGVGHTVPIEAPEQFRKHLQNFLESL